MKKPTLDTASRKTTEENPEEIRQKFTALASQGRQEVEALSSTVEMSKHPAYQEIIKMGEGVIPFLLEDLQQNPLYWLPALRQITQENPVLPEERGKIKQMAQAWLNWGRQKGYIA
ncbi:MAG: hypothetical protein F6J90_01065 [Moorea sp. SIOASIH]|uniref:hypothetical protein n=1 Tax=Moorena sp. SIOASIH TaxID=2607817 RepID=UPI0013BE1F5F|nr:hypothetical protein [Moorena sp. SIOASIH]NEO34968.1 hypothetical protein [Moorena sp. SIOASIH]